VEISASRRNFLVGAGASLASFLFPSLGFADTPKQKCTQVGQKLLDKGDWLYGGNGFVAA
jgi:hypothetical protein